MTTRTVPTSAIFSAAITLTPTEPEHFDLAADTGRGLGAGRFLTRDHHHLATVLQEGMIHTT